MASPSECNGGVEIYDCLGTHHVSSFTQSDNLISTGLDSCRVPLTSACESFDDSRDALSSCAFRRQICDHERLLPAWMVATNTIDANVDQSNMAAMLLNSAPLSAFYSTPLFTDCRQPTVGDCDFTESTRPYSSLSAEFAPQRLAQHHFVYETPMWTASDYRSTGCGLTTPLPPNRPCDGLSAVNSPLTTDHPTKLVNAGWNDYVNRWYHLANLHWTALQTRHDDVNCPDGAMNELPDVIRQQQSYLRDWASNHIAASSTTTSQEDYHQSLSSGFDSVTPSTISDRRAFQPVHSTAQLTDERFPPFQRPEVVNVSTAFAARQPPLARRLVMESAESVSHVCPDCGAEFAHRHSVRRHQRVHNGQRPYRCSVCDVTFTQSGNLRRHMRTKHCYKVLS